MNVSDQIAIREKETGHSVFGPSSLYRVLACPASVKESLSCGPGEPSIYALKGTLLHEITQKYIDAAMNQGLNEANAIRHHYEGEITDADWDAVLECYSYFKMQLALMGKDAEWELEVSAGMEDWDLPEVFGTADVRIYSPSKNVCKVIDWKFGSGVQVFATNNEQGMAYAAIAIGYPSVSKVDVEIHIAQPFLDHWDQWDLPYSELCEWVFDVLQPGIKASLEEYPEFNPGPKQCRFCPAAMECRARHEYIHEAAGEVFAAAMALRDGNKVSLEELVEAHKMFQEYKAYGSEVANYLHSLIQKGDEVPGMKLVHGRNTRTFEDSARAEAFLVALLGDKAWERKLVTPAKAEKLDKSLKKDDEFQALVNVKPGSPQLVDQSDPREAIRYDKPDHDAARDAFADFV